LNFSLEELDELFAVGTHGIKKRHSALQRWDVIRATAMTRLHRRRYRVVTKQNSAWPVRETCAVASLLQRVTARLHRMRRG
jgi:hypothetical protein